MKKNKNLLDKEFNEITKKREHIAKEISRLINRFIAHGGRVEMVVKSAENHSVMGDAFEAHCDEDCIYLYEEDLV